MVEYNTDMRELVAVWQKKRLMVLAGQMKMIKMTGEKASCTRRFVI